MNANCTSQKFDLIYTLIFDEVTTTKVLAICEYSPIPSCSVFILISFQVP